MNALDFIDNIVNNENLYSANLKYCLINEKKIPYKYNDELAKPNHIEDFVDLDTLITNTNILNYAGIGVSIQASNVYAIDIDKCFSKPFDINSADERAINIVEIFKDYCYIEFSFSGTGLRIFFKLNNDLDINKYKSKYYTKNAKTKCEFYQPLDSARYVTITGKYIINNNITIDDENLFKFKLLNFINKYMSKEEKITRSNSNASSNISIEASKRKLKYYILTDVQFQDLWFSKAPGSGSDESERDYHIIKFIYENITTNKEVIKELFESSPFFKSKDSKHIYKWEQSDFRYYNYVYNQIKEGK